MKSKLFIPDKIRVGFQQRHGTYTGKLAYVIYYDEKGKIRKEPSWLGWCDDKLGTLELDNKPRSGYLFNKGIQRSSDWYGSGRSMFRIYDPRDFEFEITSDNVIGILMHSDVSKRDIVEECVFAWSGQDLILLPVNSVEYQESIVYTQQQSNSISTKDLKPGYIYKKKKTDDEYIYIGFYEWYEWANNYWAEDNRHEFKSKKHVFSTRSGVFETPGVATFSHCVSSDPIEDFAHRVDAFFATANSQPIVGYEITYEVPDYVKEDTRQDRIPRMYMTNRDNQLSSIESHESLYYNKNLYKYYMGLDTRDTRINFFTHNKKPVFVFERRRYNEEGRYCHQIRTSRPDLNTRMEMKEYMREHNYPDDLTILQTVEILTVFGYGFLYLLLENGKRIRFEV